MSQQQPQEPNHQLDDIANQFQRDWVYGDLVNRDKFAGDKVENKVENTYVYYESSDSQPYSLTVADWHRICLARIGEQNQTKLTSNLLTQRDIDLKDIYVPLELLERKPQPQDSEPEYTIQRRVTDADFLTEILSNGKTHNNQKRRLAIIGEPGSGKSTFLQKIADCILNTNKEIAIWISLGDLQNKSLKDYLQSDWLEAALPQISAQTANVTAGMKNALAELFNSDRVWLLLDGLDEMNIATSPLAAIKQQLTGWISSARVILTCRLNVWDVDKNPLLPQFDIYQTLEFSHSNTATSSDQVNQFITNWFKHSLQEQGKHLQIALEQPEHQHLKDLVKNPLRLALLCRIWQSLKGKLPNTKFELYREFVTAIYQWKQEQFPEIQSLQQREILNHNLGKLAIKAIDSYAFPFHLDEKLIYETLTPQEFKLAVGIGWLKLLRKSQAHPGGEDIYVFFHQVFLEYFVAQAVHNWREFLNYNPGSLDIDTYRIFSPQWREVILLWLEQEKAKVSLQQKQEFIEALVEFKDKYQGENIFQTCTFLVADCLIAANLSQHRLSSMIYEQLLNIYQYSIYNLLREAAFQILKRFNKSALFQFLKIQLNNTNKYNQFKILQALGELSTQESLELLTNQYLNAGNYPNLVVSSLIRANTNQAIKMLYKIFNKLIENEERGITSSIIRQLADANIPEYINLLLDIGEKTQTPPWMRRAIFIKLIATNTSLAEVRRGFLNYFNQVINQKNISNILEIYHQMTNIKFVADDTILEDAKQRLESDDKNLVLVSVRFLSQQNSINWKQLANLLEIHSHEEELFKVISKSLLQSQNPEAERYAITKYIEKYPPRDWEKEWIIILGKFGGQDSFVDLFKQLKLFVTDTLGNQEIEAAIIESLYKISKRIDIHSINELCNHILTHLRRSEVQNDNLAEAVVYFLCKLGTENQIKNILKIAGKQQLISEGLLRYIDAHRSAEYLDFIDECITSNTELSGLYFTLKFHLLNTTEEKQQLLQAVFTSNNYLLYREAMELAYTLYQPEELLSIVIPLLQSSDVGIVDKAIEILGKIGNEVTINQLLPLRHQPEYTQTAFQALFDIAKRQSLLYKLEFKN